MKKLITLIAVVAMAFVLVACGETTTLTVEGKTITASSIEELEEIVNKDVTDTITALQTEGESLKTEIDDFDTYLKNVSKVQEFYDKVLAETKAICLRMREYSICYAKIVLNSNMSNEDKYDAFSDMYDCIYDDACGEIYDAIYDDLMGDMYDAFYSGVISDGYDYTIYDKWYDASSDAYDMWSDCLSDVYDEWSDALSDIYDFWSDVHETMWDGDTVKTKEEIAKFEEDIKALREKE